jgi:predicted chitinase
MAHFFNPFTNAPVVTYKILTTGVFRIGLWGGGHVGPLWTGSWSSGRLDVTSRYIAGSEKWGDWTSPLSGINPVASDPAVVSEHAMGSNRRLLTISVSKLKSSKLHALYYGAPYAEPLSLVHVHFPPPPEPVVVTETAARTLIVNSLIKSGISNRFLRVGIVSVVSTEGGFSPRNEISYRTTPNARIRTIFPGRVPDSDAILNLLKEDDVAFFDAVYGGTYGSQQLGNTEYGDGYNYRGRGFNGITGKILYQRYSRLTGIDLLSFPDKLNEPAIAADCLAGYFNDSLKDNRNACHQRYGVFPERINDLPTAVKVAFSCNAGWGAKWWENPVLKAENDRQLAHALTFDKLL